MYTVLYTKRKHLSCIWHIYIYKQCSAFLQIRLEFLDFDTACLADIETLYDGPDDRSWKILWSDR